MLFKGLSDADIQLALKITTEDFVAHKKTTYEEYEIALKISINLIRRMNKKKDTFKSA